MNKEFNPQKLEELKKLVNDKNINLGSIDTSLITDIRELFKYSKEKIFQV